LLLWAKFIADHADDQVEWQEILKELMARDKSITYLNKLPEDRLQIELNFIKNGIVGLRKYLRSG
jgi:hypothetical protein